MYRHYDLFNKAESYVTIGDEKVAVTTLIRSKEREIINEVFDTDIDYALRGMTIEDQLTECRFLYRGLPFAVSTRRYTPMDVAIEDKREAYNEGMPLDTLQGARIYAVLATEGGILLGLFIDGNHLLWIGDTVTIAHIDTTGDNNGAGYKGTEDSYTPLSLVINPDIKGMDIDGYYKPNEALKETDSVTIPDGVRIIAPYAFKGAKMSELIIPEGVEVIERYAFAGCENLKSVSLPDSLKRIGGNAFEGCVSLESIRIPDGIRTVERHTFRGCSSLKTVDLGQVETIEGYAFMECPSLLPPDLSRVKHLYAFSFADCMSFTEITIPKSIETMAFCVYRGCMNLKRVVFDGLPRNIDEPFNFCDNLEVIIAPEYAHERLREMLESSFSSKVRDLIDFVRLEVKK